MLARTIAKRSARSVGALGQTRTFAKKKAATKKSEPAVAPKELFGVHGRYATALFLSASKAGTTNKVEKELAVSIQFYIVWDKTQVHHNWALSFMISTLLKFVIHFSTLDLCLNLYTKTN